MFYMQLLVNKRGPLAKIWLAAHWEKKLTKAHIFECNLETTVQKLLSPKFTIALRTSGHLLLGVVRIYHRKAKYLLADCSEALTKMKTAFRPGLLDLPEESSEAAYQSITLPEEFHDFETPLPDLNAIDVAEHFTLNQSRAEDITLTEDNESNILLCHRNFGERKAEPDTLRKNSFFDGSILTSSNSLMADHNSASVSGDKSVLQEDIYCLEHDCFGDEEDAADMIEILLRDEQNGLDKDILDVEEECPLSQDLMPENSMAGEFAAPAPSCSHKPSCADTTTKDVSHQMNETILWLEEKEGFVLKPVVDTAVTQRKKKKRKRKLLVDVVKELSCSAIYNQLNNCTDTLAALDLAPPTKKTMLWKKSGGVDTLLSCPAQPVGHPKLQMVTAQFSGGFCATREAVRASWLQVWLREMLIVDEPSYLQELAHLETERNTGNDLLMLMSGDSRQEPEDKGSDTTQEGTACSESSSLESHSLGQAAEPQRDEPAKVCVLGAKGSDLFQERTGFSQKYFQKEKTEKDSEEIKWNKRTLQLLKTLQVLHLRRSGVSSVSFRELCRKNSRKEAAAKFYTMLVLKKQSVIELAQSAPFADIAATAGPLLGTL
ncbi:RD21L protein, partial [Halcyon senegalensis]|nr:RD21L protein [Halcyon senegalensis]